MRVCLKKWGYRWNRHNFLYRLMYLARNLQVVHWQSKPKDSPGGKERRWEYLACASGIEWPVVCVGKPGRSVPSVAQKKLLILNFRLNSRDVETALSQHQFKLTCRHLATGKFELCLLICGFSALQMLRIGDVFTYSDTVLHLAAFLKYASVRILSPSTLTRAQYFFPGRRLQKSATDWLFVPVIDIKTMSD